jgi:hypothetical protein
MKEQVIVFEGEQMFVAPKKRISNKQKGLQVEVPEVNAEGDPTVTEPAEPIRIITTPPSGSGDIGVRTPQTFVTQQPVAPSPTMGTLPPRLPVEPTPIDPTPTPVLGNPTRNLPPAAEEQPTPPPAPTLPPPPAPADILIRKEIIAPLGLGSAPIMGGGGIGGGGGGGGAEEEGVAVEKKKSYWWLWLLLIGGAAYYYSKKKK